LRLTETGAKLQDRVGAELVNPANLVDVVDVVNLANFGDA
jgi:hypothetical protein